MISAQPQIDARQFFQTGNIQGATRGACDLKTAESEIQEMNSGFDQLVQMDNSAMDQDPQVGKLNVDTARVKFTGEFSGTKDNFSYSLTQPSALGDSYLEVSVSPEKALYYKNRDAITHDPYQVHTKIEARLLDRQNPELSYILTK